MSGQVFTTLGLEETLKSGLLTIIEEKNEIDHIYGWEAETIDPLEQWNSVPPEIMGKTSWYNIAASSEKENPNNPWTFVREIAKLKILWPRRLI